MQAWALYSVLARPGAQSTSMRGAVRSLQPKDNCRPGAKVEADTLGELPKYSGHASNACGYATTSLGQPPLVWQARGGAKLTIKYISATT